MALIFDTETNGLPICKSYSEFPCYTDLSKYDSARLVQISYILTNSSFNNLEESDDIIKADNFKIENTQFHGITDAISYNKGIPFVEFAEKFNNTLDFVDTIIAHNINFDINVLRAELYRYNLLDIIIKLDSKKMICTMQYTKYIVCAKFKSGTGIKDPSLKELYQYFVKKEITNQHNSKYDTFNLWTIVKIMYDKNLIKIS
jgi:DNA polymerase III epsilon subunit-like protein